MFSPTYIWPISSFSGRFGPPGSRQVVVGIPLGSEGPDWIVLYVISLRFAPPPRPSAKRIFQ
jgi:hypothetical protein